MGDKAGLPSDEVNSASSGSQINIGSLGGFVGNLGSGNTTGNISSSGSEVGQLKSLAHVLDTNLEKLATDGVDRERLISILARIEAALAEPGNTPKLSRTNQVGLSSGRMIIWPVSRPDLRALS